MNRTLTLVVAGALTLGLLTGCGSKPADTYKKDPGAPQKSLAKLKIGQLPIIDGLPFWVAEQKEYYKQQGVEVELVTFRSANERDSALVAGEIDGMLADPIATTTLVASGTKVKITSMALGATQAEGPIGILVSEKSGITTVEQLKGVEIAVSTYSMIHYVTEKLLLENGFKPEEIKVTNMPQIPVRFESLVGGQIRAATLPDPLLTFATSKGAKIILNDAKAKQNYSISVIDFSEKAIAEKADSIKQFFIAYNRAVADIKTAPQSYIDLLTEKAKLDPEVKKVYKVLPSSFAQAPKKEDLESVVNWLSDKKVINSKVTYEQLVNASLLPTR